MFGVTTSDDYRPVAWIGRYPLRVTSILCALFVLGMFGTVMAETARWDYTWLAFRTYPFLHGYIWEPITAPLIQPANFFFLFNILFFYWSGNQVEQLLGIRRYLQLIAILIVVPVLVLLAWGRAGTIWTYAGSYELMVGMFIAFAALYPDLQVFGWVDLKWLAFAGLVLALMSFLPTHDWGSLTILLGMCAASFAFIRYVQGRIPMAGLARYNPFRPKPKIYVMQKPLARRSPEPEDITSSIDPILDKISRSGIASLTEAERRQLDRARKKLLKQSE